MADEQDKAEALDEEKLTTDEPQPDPVDLVDQTADADPGAAEVGRSEIDAGEAGDAMVGIEDDPDRWPDVARDEVPAPEVAAMHVVDEP
jgi:hypothetical protein